MDRAIAAGHLVAAAAAGHGTGQGDGTEPVDALQQTSGPATAGTPRWSSPAAVRRRTRRPRVPPSGGAGRGRRRRRSRRRARQEPGCRAWPRRPGCAAAGRGPRRRTPAVAGTFSRVAILRTMRRTLSRSLASGGPLCRTARRNSPWARGLASSADVEFVAPADSPNTVTRSGSPPNRAIDSRTHSSAASWSRRNPAFGSASGKRP